MSAGMVVRSDLEKQAENPIGNLSGSFSSAEAIRIVSVALGANQNSANRLVEDILIKKHSVKVALSTSFAWGIWIEQLDDLASVVNWILNYEGDKIQIIELEDRMWEFFNQYSKSASKNGGRGDLAVFITRFNGAIRDCLM